MVARMNEMNWVQVGVRVAFGAVVVLVSAYLLYLIRSVLVLLLVGIIFAEAIAPIVVRLRKLGARRAHAVLVVYTVLALGGATFLWLVERTLEAEADTLAAALPKIQQNAAQLAEQMPVPPLRERMLEAVALEGPAPVAAGEQVPGRLAEAATALGRILFSVSMVLVIAYYWTSERLLFRRAFVSLIAAQHRERAVRIWDRVEHKLGAWVRGQLVLMGTMGLAFGVGLALLGVPYAILLATLAALTVAIPLVGAYLVTTPAVLVALTQSPQLAATVLVFGVLVQLLQGNLLAPRVLGRATGISPLTIILGLLVGTTLMGWAGAFIAVPVAAGMQVLLNELGVFEEAEESREPILREVAAEARSA
jgi:predicted PurR-regulated permease PerM